MCQPVSWAVDTGLRSQGADEWEVTDDWEREGDRPRPGNQGSAQTHTAVGSGSQRTAGPAPAREPRSCEATSARGWISKRPSDHVRPRLTEAVACRSCRGRSAPDRCPQGSRTPPTNAGRATWPTGKVPAEPRRPRCRRRLTSCGGSGLAGGASGWPGSAPSPAHLALPPRRAACLSDVLLSVSSVAPAWRSRGRREPGLWSLRVAAAPRRPAGRGPPGAGPRSVSCLVSRRVLGVGRERSADTR